VTVVCTRKNNRQRLAANPAKGHVSCVDKTRVPEHTDGHHAVKEYPASSPGPPCRLRACEPART